MKKTLVVSFDSFEEKNMSYCLRVLYNLHFKSAWPCQNIIALVLSRTRAQYILINCYFTCKVTEPESFRQWRETMAAELTGSQDRILRGPGWSGCCKKDVGIPTKGRFNIAAVNTRTTNKRLAAATTFSTEPYIQVFILLN